MKKHGKKFLSLALALCMALALVPMTAQAGGFPEEDHVIWLNYGTENQVEIDTSAEDDRSGESWSWDGTEKILRLNNFTGTGLFFSQSGDVTLELTGNNTILTGSKHYDLTVAAYHGTCYVTVTGDGQLTADTCSIQGLNSSTRLSLQSGTLIFNKGGIEISNGGTLAVYGGSLQGTGGDYGLHLAYGGKVLAVGGEMTLAGEIGALVRARGVSTSDLDYEFHDSPFDEFYMDAVGGETSADGTALQMKETRKLEKRGNTSVCTQYYALAAGELTLDEAGELEGTAKYARLTPSPDASVLSAPYDSQWGEAYDDDWDYDDLEYDTSAQPTAAPAAQTAYASTQTVLVDGAPVTFHAYALKDASGNDTNYVKLRDVAAILNGSAAQFEVGWDGAITITTKTAYTPNGSENIANFSGNQSYTVNTSPVKVNGADAALDAITLTDAAGGGYTYFKLRDLGAALDFEVDWNDTDGITITTSQAVATLTDGSEITDENIRRLINALRTDYPEGMRWTNENSHYSPALRWTGLGCEGFALLCSDAAFGDLPITATHSSFDDIRVGDLVRMGHTHTVIVLEKKADSVVVAEGNFNSSIHWGREITRQELVDREFTVRSRWPK